MIINPKLLKMIFKEKVLFENENGKAGDVLFNPLNYKRIVIEYVDPGLSNKSSKEIYVNEYLKENTKFWLSFNLFDSTGNVYFYASAFSLDNEGIKLLNQTGNLIISIANEIHINKTNSVRITKVTGYNY